MDINDTDAKINVGLQLMDKLYVKVRRATFQKDAYLTMTDTKSLDFSIVSAESVQYNIVPSGLISGADIDFVRTYKFRADSGRDSTVTQSDKMGVFDVFNEDR